MLRYQVAAELPHSRGLAEQSATRAVLIINQMEELFSLDQIPTAPSDDTAGLRYGARAGSARSTLSARAE